VRAYLPTNAAGAALWAAGIGLGAFYGGPVVVDLVNDLGVLGLVLVAVVTVVLVALEVARRARLRARRREASRAGY
jgi:membrane protein DedA with SNARE-associated domain